MRQFEAVNRPSRAKRGTDPSLTSVQDRQPKRHKRQTKPPYLMNGSELPSTNMSTDQTWKSPRIMQPVQRERFADLAESNRSLRTGMVPSSPELHEPSSPRQASSPEADAT
jgi:hypothetical protein